PDIQLDVRIGVGLDQGQLAISCGPQIGRVANRNLQLIVDENLGFVKLEVRTLDGVQDLNHRASHYVLAELDLSAGDELDLAFGGRPVFLLLFTPLDELCHQVFNANVVDRMKLTVHGERPVRI